MKLADKIQAEYLADKSAMTINGTREVSVTPKGVAKFLTFIVGGLLGAHLLATGLNKVVVTKNIFVDGFHHLFHLVSENSIPAVFSFLLLLFSSALLLYISSFTTLNTHRKYWLGLSLIFLFLSMDEILAIHERVDAYIRMNHFNDVFGFSEYVWAVPYVIAFLIIGFLYLKFIFQLPNLTRNLIFISGFVFVFAAAGLDFIQGYIQMHDIHTVFYWILTTIEEPMEMLGVILFLYALLNYISPNNGKIYIGPRSQVKDVITNGIKLNK